PTWPARSRTFAAPNPSRRHSWPRWARAAAVVPSLSWRPPWLGLSLVWLWGRPVRERARALEAGEARERIDIAWFGSHVVAASVGCFPATVRRRLPKAYFLT